MDRGALWATVFGVIRVGLNLETKQQQQWHSYHCSSAKQRDSSWLDVISLEGMILERTWRFRMKALLAVGGSTASVILRCLSMDGDQLGTKFHWSMVQWEDKDTVMKFAWNWISSSEKAVLYLIWCLLSSVQFSHSVMSDSLQPHEPQHTRPPCPSPTPWVYLNPCPLCRWCHPTISSSVIPFSSCPQCFPASGSFQMSQLFASGGQRIRVSSSTSVLPMKTQDWSPLEWTCWISSQSKGLSRVFSNTTLQKHQFFSAQLSL